MAVHKELLMPHTLLILNILPTVRAIYSVLFLVILSVRYIRKITSVCTNC